METVVSDPHLLRSTESLTIHNAWSPEDLGGMRLKLATAVGKQAFYGLFVTALESIFTNAINVKILVINHWYLSAGLIPLVLTMHSLQTLDMICCTIPEDFEHITSSFHQAPQCAHHFRRRRGTDSVGAHL